MTHRKRGGSKPAPPPEEAELFRQAVSDATRLPAHDRVEHPRSRPKPRRLEHDTLHHDTLSDYVPGPAREPGEPLAFARPGLQKRVVAQLRKRSAVDAELDLHGLTVPDARRMLAEFLVEARDHGLRFVRIIHGKGLRSDAGVGVIKSSVASWLMQWEDVLAFNEAPQRSGGAGAVVVLLRTAR